jgi:hypothetical protein
MVLHMAKITDETIFGIVIMKSSTRTYLLAFLGIFILFIPFAFQVIPWFEWSDGCEHAAAIRELNYSFLHPLNPHLNLPGETSPRYVPSIVIMAVFQKIIACDIFTILGFSSFVAFVFLGFGIYCFAKEYFQDEIQPVYTLLSLLFLWGRGWDGANSIMFSSLVYNAYYPSVISFILIFFALTAMLKYLRQRRLSYFSAFVIVSSFAFLNHPLTGILLFFITSILVVAEGYLEKRIVILFFLSFVIAVVVTSLWPYYSFLKGVLFMIEGKGRQFWDYQAGYNLHYSGHLIRIGPGFLGILTIVYFGIKKQYRFIVAGFLTSLIIYIVGYFLKIILAERFIFLCMFFSQLAFSRVLKNSLHESPDCLRNRWRRALRFMFVATLAVGLSSQLYLAARMYLPQYIEWRPQLHLKKYSHPLQHYLSLRHSLQRGDIVLTDIETSWILPCITDVKVIALFHNSPFVLENLERARDTKTFFTTPLSREGIVKKYNISHILINKRKVPQDGGGNEHDAAYLPNPEEALFNTLSALGRVIVNDENFFLVKVRKIGTAQYD